MTVAAARSERMTINVINGDLRFVRGSIMVGHYRSTSLTGSERIVDLVFKGVLDDSLRIGGYPHRPGDCQLFVNPFQGREGAYFPQDPDTAVVVGLGQEGKLTVPDHVATVRHGVERFTVWPAIENKTDIDNCTENRHGISGYLSDEDVALRIYEQLI